jgi:sugar lactone lactonase YvrE
VFKPLPVPRNQLAESPFWHPTQQRLFWCDIKARHVHAYDPATQVLESWTFDSEPGCIAPAEGNNIVVALRGQVELLDVRTGERKKITDIPHNTAELRSNDGKCDALGRFWIGTVFEPKTSESAALWCLQSKGKEYAIERVIGDNITANGLAFSPDNTQMYWAHTAQHRIDVMKFDLTGGVVSKRREWVKFPDKSAPGVYGGRPDGAAMDVEGCYWTAMYEGGCVLRLSPLGKVMARYEVPTAYPTMPCFGGADLRTLYLTSADSQASLQADPRRRDGLIFSAQVDVPGVASNRFRLAA